MSNWKRKLALLLTLAMLISALPLNASAAEEAAEEPTAEDAALEEIGFQMRYMGEMVDAIATVNPDKLDAGVEEDEEGSVTAYYVPFEDDGGYTFYPERTEMPYTVRFDVNGREFVYVFGTESDTTVIGGHEFRVECQDTPEPEVPEDEQLYVTVGGEQIPLIPQDVPTTMSMLPLKEQYYTLDLTGRFPSELKAVNVETLLKSLTTDRIYDSTTQNPNDVAVWTRWGCYDEDGNYISVNDDYTRVSGTTMDLSYGANTRNTYRLEFIVGTADQLNASNCRYIITVEYSQLRDNITPFTFTFDDVPTSNEPIASVYYNSRYRNGKAFYQVTAKDRVSWNGQDQLTLKLEKYHDEYNDFWRVFNSKNDLDYKVYEGYHESSEGLTNDIRSTFESTGLLRDYTYQSNLASTPAVTVVFSRGGNEVYVMPFYIVVHKSEDYVNANWLDTTAYDVASNDEPLLWADYDWNDALNCEEYIFNMPNSRPANGTYYVKADYWHDNDLVDFQDIRDYVTKTVEGQFTSASAISDSLPDVTNQLFNGGYPADYSGGKVFTVVLKRDNSVFNFAIRTKDYVEPEKNLPSAPTPLSQDTYFRMQGANKDAGGGLNAYFMPYDADSYYYNGFQTVFLLDGTSPVAEDSTIKPVFWTGNKVVMFAGHNKDGHTDSAERQTSGETEREFKNGEAILYSAAAENGANLKNYWVTFVTQDTNGAKLFVNGINDPSRIDKDTQYPIREVMLTEAYGNHHDIFFANIGNQTLEGLTVTLDAEAQEIVKLDDYWTVGATKTLAPFTTTNKRDADGNWVSYGELANVAKIRLVPKTDAQGNQIAGDIKGTLTISSTNGGSVTLKLTGKSGAPKIVTDTIRDGIKFVHYSSLIQTNYMYGTGDIAFSITSGRLPNGMQIKPNGEIYGVPTEVGEFTIEVTATNTKTNQSDKHSYTFKIEQNTYDNVEAANMDDQGYPIKNRLPDNIEGTMWSQDQVLESEGEYSQFMNVYLDGRQLTANTDYTSEEGSTKITVRSQTLRNAGNGTHTISAEFRTGHSTSGTMKRTAQNFTISGLSTPSGGGSSSGGSSSGGSSSGRRPSSSTPKPATKPAETPAQTPTTPTAPATTAEKFKDISAQQWFYADVDWAFKNNLMVGVTDSSYHPYDKISFVTGVVVLSRLDKVDLDQQTPAEGIPAGQWYTAAASWAKANDLLPENGFQGSSAMSRGEMAVMLLKYLKYMKVDCSLLGSPVEFTDAALMTQEQNDAFQVLYQFGIFKGVGNQTMDVSGSTTRAQFAALLHRLSVFAEAQQKNA